MKKFDHQDFQILELGSPGTSWFWQLVQALERLTSCKSWDLHHLLFYHLPSLYSWSESIHCSLYLNHKNKQKKNKTELQILSDDNNGPCAIYGQRKSRSVCIYVQSNLGIFSLSTYTTVSTESVSRQQQQDQPVLMDNAQADQGLHCLQITYGSFRILHIIWQMMKLIFLPENRLWH